MKLPFSFGYPFFLRSIIPGIAWAVFSYKLISPVMTQLGPDSLIARNLEVFYISEVVIGGILVSLCNLKILRLLRRGFWRLGLGSWLVKRINAEIDRKRKEAERLEKEKQYREFDKIWAWLSRFPLDEQGNPRAVFPTRLGNIIYGYETQPRLTHGLEPGFYWYRIWVTLDRDTRREISTVSAESDCLIHCSFVLFLLFIIYSFALIVILVGLSLLFPAPLDTYFLLLKSKGLGVLVFLMIVTFLLGWSCYELALPLLRVVGEYFKSMFEVFYKKVFEISLPSSDEKDRFEKLFQYLRYLNVKCSKCGHIYSYTKQACPECQTKRPVIENWSKEIREPRGS